MTGVRVVANVLGSGQLIGYSTYFSCNVMGKLFSTISVVFGLSVLLMGLGLYLFGMPEGDLCSSSILASDYSHIAESEREGACLDDSFKSLGMVSALTAISLVGGGIISLISSIWAWFAWRKKKIVVETDT